MQAAPATVVAESDVQPVPGAARARDRKPLILWLLAGALLLTGLGGRPVQRTQEARVLEVARQMLGKPLDRWMVPRVNDRLRLRKPPLAYWATAAAYTLGGVSEGVGRIPTALASWLTLAGVYWAGAWLFGRRTGLLAAAALLSSYLFLWHARLAETDPWATLFVTFGTLAFWKGITPDHRGVETRASVGKSALWFHLGAACVALASLSKGAPALFPILFLIGLSLVRRPSRALWEFVRCGALVTAVVPGLLWLGYAKRHADLGQIAEEFSNNWRGEGHGAPFYSYFYLLPLAAAPWTGVMVLAIVEAARRCRRDSRLQGLMAWAASVLLPLFVTGNKQPHYLMMVMPCLMVLVGWALNEMLEYTGRAAPAETPRDALADGPALNLDYASGIPSPDPAARFAGAVATVFRVTVGICAVAALGAPLAARNLRGTVRLYDFAVTAALVLAMGAVAFVARRRGFAAAVMTFAAAWAIALTVCNAWWWPTVEPNDPRAVAAEFRKVAGDGPYCSYASVAYLPLCFALRAEVPAALTPEELRAQLAAEPQTHVIIRRRVRNERTVLDPSFVREVQVRNDDVVFELYRPGRPQ